MNANPNPAREDDIAASLPELAGLISGRVAAWCDYGYENPPTPDHASIPPLGQRSAEAIRNGHQAVRDIDEMIRKLHALRGQLVSELRQDADIHEVRADAILARHQQERRAAAEEDEETLTERTDGLEIRLERLENARRQDQRAAALAQRMSRKSGGARNAD